MPRTHTRTRRKIAASIAVVGLLAAAVTTVVFSAFTSVTQNSGNTFNAGSISLDNSADGVLFQMAGMKPGTTRTRCIKVNHTTSGGMTSTVRLYGAGSGGLGPYLSTKVVRGSDAAPAGTSVADKTNCVGFQADATDFPGGPAGAGVLFDGKLSAYPASWETGLVDPDAAWGNKSVVYAITVTLDDADAAKNLAATQQFTFEARNS